MQTGMAAARFRNLFLWLTLLPLAGRAENASAPGAVLVEKEKIVEAQTRNGAWKPAVVGLALAVHDRLRTGEFSRAAVRFTDLSMLRVDELTTIEISPPTGGSGRQTLDQQRGGTYFFSRDKAQEIEIRTPAANGALRGTEFELRVAANGRTRLTMFDGEVDIGNAHGRVQVRSGEQVEVEVGRAPRKTAVIEASNIIQWCLYYPAVLDPAELHGLDASLGPYRAGDLPGALAALGRVPAASADARLFRAAVILSSGQVDKARAALAGVPAHDSRRQAIEQLIAAVKLQPWSRTGEPRTSSEWLAESYYQQSRGGLEAALRAARKATELSPQFGYAWARVAELEFSFGRTVKAMKVLESGLELAPKNAQAHALQGFLLSAENRMGAARRSFENAIALDGALGNAWLGRGLSSIRQGHEDDGRRDLQTAAVLEPNRSILRSYLGKAFSQVGNSPKANLELDRAKQLDPNDPTPWLYSAIQRKQENRYNEAIDDLEKSVALNENRRIYRSRFLLDQDIAIRGTNLAAIYEKDGMIEQSVREAVRAVNTDYSSAAAHLFLSNSYSARSDPNRIALRFESGALNELLLSNLLSPVGGGPLSQFVSQQEYSKLFAKDGLGISSVTEYRSDGEFSETASQYGTFGNISYALDAAYKYRDGVRPNNGLSSFDGFATFKLQLTPLDTVFFQAQFADARSGDVFQRYDPSAVGRESSFEVPDGDGNLRKVVNKNTTARSFHLHDQQDPALLMLGWHHEWSPGQHTLLLLSRLGSDQTVSAQDVGVNLVDRNVSLVAPLDVFPTSSGSGDDLVVQPQFALLRALRGRGLLSNIGGASFDLNYRSTFEAYAGELQQIVNVAGHTILVGGRFQRGEFDTHVRLTNYDNGTKPFKDLYFAQPPVDDGNSVQFERINCYLYDTWHPAGWLSITGGVTYDSMHYPDNFRSPPLNDDQAAREQFSPKAGFAAQPWRGATLRGAYAKAIGGTSFDESVRLEPTQVQGFLQSYRSVISESLVGAVAGSQFTFYGASFEQKLPTRTYLGAEFDVLKQDLDRTVGVFDDFQYDGERLGTVPSSLTENDTYREDALTATVNQLIGDTWSLGGRYRYTHSRFRQQIPALRSALARVTDPARFDALAGNGLRDSEASLHELSLFALYNHPCGFFARAEANWYQQANDTRTAGVASFSPTENSPRLRIANSGPPGDDFWQFNVLTGYRFYRDQCELSFGVLNLTGQDYQLNPLNPYAELPRDRTFVVRCRLSF